MGQIKKAGFDFLCEIMCWNFDGTVVKITIADRLPILPLSYCTSQALIVLEQPQENSFSQGCCKVNPNYLVKIRKPSSRSPSRGKENEAQGQGAKGNNGTFCHYLSVLSAKIVRQKLKMAQIQFIFLYLPKFICLLYSFGFLADLAALLAGCLCPRRNNAANSKPRAESYFPSSHSTVRLDQ